MLLRLGLLFTLIPLIETYVLIRVGQTIGPLQTVLLLLLSGLLGAWLARREGTQIIRQLIADLSQGLPPGVRLVEGLMVLVGAVLLVTPGVVTDLVGLVLLFPPTRRALAPFVLAALLRRFNVEGFRIGAPPPPGAPPPGSPGRDARRPPFDHPVR